jgi:hypothetical protein
MTEALQPTIDHRSLTTALLANRGMLSLEKATTYLVGRARVRTPLGASEFLEMCIFDENGRGAFDERVKLALTVCNLYREMFPREYRASQSPPFSTQREQEFYRLVNLRLFPLCISENRRETEVDDLIRRHPRFFLPFILVSGTQQHGWINGCCGFDGIQIVFKLALALIGHESPRGWQALSSYYRLARDLHPSPPLAAVGWTHFAYSCAVDDSPLRHLPLAFHMVVYKTGNPWLDVPPGEAFGMEWGKHNVARLFLARRQAEEINASVLTLNQWLVEDPATRIARAVELWNAAAKMEAESGHAGMYVDGAGRLR